MVSRIALTIGFATAASLTLAACSDPVPDPRLIDPMDVRAVGMIRDGEGDLRCNHTMIGPNLSATSLHCIRSRDRFFAVLDENGDYIDAQKGNLAAPGLGWITQNDTGAEIYMTDTHYLESAMDKAITLLTDDIGDISGTMQIAPLDALDWQPLENADGILRASVYLLTYRPDPRNDDGYVFYRESCNAFRLVNVSEVIAHDCPTRSGVSGSPIVMPVGNDEYALIAVHESTTTRTIGSPLAQAFVPAFPDSRLMRFASVFGSMPALCETISNCRAERNGEGYATLALTN